jgi:hypothetical protein
MGLLGRGRLAASSILGSLSHQPCLYGDAAHGSLADVKNNLIYTPAFPSVKEVFPLL